MQELIPGGRVVAHSYDLRFPHFPFTVSSCPIEKLWVTKKRIGSVERVINDILILERNKCNKGMEKWMVDNERKRGKEVKREVGVKVRKREREKNVREERDTFDR